MRAEGVYRRAFSLGAEEGLSRVVLPKQHPAHGHVALRGISSLLGVELSRCYFDALVPNHFKATLPASKTIVSVTSRSLYYPE